MIYFPDTKCMHLIRKFGEVMPHILEKTDENIQ